MYRCALGSTSLGSRLLRQKMQRSLPERQTERKNRCLRLPRHPGHPQLKYGKASATSLKNEVDKGAISCFSKRKDWRFAVRAKSFALHWRSRGFFRGHVRSCEKGLCKSKSTGDSRFAPNLLPYTGVRAVFFGVTCAVVRKVYARARVHKNKSMQHHTLGSGTAKFQVT